jgi:hypothetical protein
MTRGQPKVTVDYVAEYNKISRPANYDPNQNAAQSYQEAFENFVKMPVKLSKISAEWPSDFNESNQDLLKKWVTAIWHVFKI